MSLSKRLRLGAIATGIFAALDQLGRTALLGQLGFQVKPGSDLSKVMAVVFSLPPLAWAVAAFVLFVSWILASPELRGGRGATNAEPPLSLKLMGFEHVNALELDDEMDFKHLESTVWQGWLVFAVWLQAESLDGPRRAEDWQIRVFDESGKAIHCQITEKTWPAPKSWPKIDYCGFVAVQHHYIKPDQVYNVRFNLAVASGDGQMRLQVRCRDRDSGKVVEAIG